MRTLTAAVIAATLAATSAQAAVAFFKYSYVSGLNRICVYDHLGSKYVTTIPAAQLCPISIRL